MYKQKQLGLGFEIVIGRKVRTERKILAHESSLGVDLLILWCLVT